MQKKRSTGLIPPPPPVVPQLSQGLAPPSFMPMQAPRYDSPDPVLMATPPQQQTQTQQLKPMTLPPEFAKTLLDSLSAQDAIVKKANSDVTNFQPMELPNAPELSPFEQQLNEGLQQRMQDLITGKESVGQRFGRGFDVGQKLAANILVPLMGTFSGDAGSAMGLAEATRMLKQQSVENDRQRAAERSANNSSLLNLANLWQNLDPKSAKNLSTLASQRLRVAKENNDTRNDKVSKLLQAQHNRDMLANQMLSTILKANDQVFDQSAAVNKDSRDTLELSDKLRHRGVTESVQKETLELKKKGDKRDAERLTLSKNADARAAQKLIADETQDKAVNTFKEANQKFENQKLLNTALRNLTNDSQAKNALGQPKYGADYIDRILSNPGYVSLLDDLAKKSGVNLTAKEMLEGMRTKQQLVESSDWTGDLIQSGLSGLGALMGGGSKAVMPERSDPMQAAFDKFVQEKGRKPTAQELHKMLNGG